MRSPAFADSASQVHHEPTERSSNLVIVLAKFIFGFTTLVATSILSGCTAPAAGCSSCSVATGPLVTITAQPANTSVPVGSTATFSITATTTGTSLTYEWFKNGNLIGGATSASYTTPATSAADDGAAFTASAVDGLNFAISRSAVLTVILPPPPSASPRAPKAGDLRFQQVDSPAAAAIANTIRPTSYTLSTFPGGQASASYSSSIGSPLAVGTAALTCDPAAPANCVWDYSIYALPSSLQTLSASYMAGPVASLPSALAALPASTSVITSLDVPPGMASFAMAVANSSQNAGFDRLLEVVPANAVQATVSADGLKSRVVTAVYFDSTGMANIMSYGWQADPTTRYDTATSIVAPADVASAAKMLGAQGYIITAFGGNDANSYILVGTKVQGDTAPRPTFIQTESSNSPSANTTVYADMNVIFLGYGPGANPQSATNSNFTYVTQQ